MPTPQPMYFLGLDPGVSGGIAVLTERGEIVSLDKMPTTELDLVLLLTHYDMRYAAPHQLAVAFAVIERVHSMPKQGHNGAFTFGKNYGSLLTALTACRIPFDLVTPQKWQQAMGCLTKGDKNVSKRRAQQLFPNAPTITHAHADALLIAEFCRRIRTGTHGQEKEGNYILDSLDHIR